MKMKYSAEEIRDAILKLKAFQEDKMTLLRIEDMLNLSAGMVERANSMIEANAKDLEYRHRDADAVLMTANFILTGKMR